MSAGCPVAVQAVEDEAMVGELRAVSGRIELPRLRAESGAMSGSAERLELPGVHEFVPDDAGEGLPVETFVGAACETDGDPVLVWMVAARTSPSFRSAGDLPVDPVVVDVERDAPGVVPGSREDGVGCVGHTSRGRDDGLNLPSKRTVTGPDR